MLSFPDDADARVKLVDGRTWDVPVPLPRERGRWYRLRVRVTRDRLEAWVDDRKPVALSLTENSLTLEGFYNQSRPFSLQSWDAKLAFRNIRLRRLGGPEGKGAEEEPGWVAGRAKATEAARRRESERHRRRDSDSRSLVLDTLGQNAVDQRSEERECEDEVREEGLEERADGGVREGVVVSHEEACGARPI
jgi:hypothetical protein